MKVAYVVKRYPRYSETFIVNEILEHEAVGLPVEIFSLRQSVDTHFQDNIARVRAPVTYLLVSGKTSEFVAALHSAADSVPEFWTRFGDLPSANPQELHQAVNLARMAVESGVTQFHAHFATSATAVAQLASQLSGIPYSFTAHAKDIYHESVDREDLSRKMRDAARIVTVSDFNLSHLRAEFPESADRVVRIYNGLRLTDFPFTSPTERAPLIVGVGRLVEKKGFDTLIRAARVLADAGEDFRCRIIGTGEDRAMLEELIRTLDVAAYVELTGPRPQSEVKEELRRAAVFAAPCVLGGDGNRDGLPTVLLEAMALGAPCVSTDVTGIPEVIIDGKTGLEVPQRDPIRLADAILRLMHDSRLRVELAEAARRLIEREFDAERNTGLLRERFSGTRVYRDTVYQEAV